MRSIGIHSQPKTEFYTDTAQQITQLLLVNERPIAIFARVQYTHKLTLLHGGRSLPHVTNHTQITLTDLLVSDGS